MLLSDTARECAALVVCLMSGLQESFTKILHTLKMGTLCPYEILSFGYISSQSIL